MLRPSHKPSRFSATRIFTGRSYERDVFTQAIAETGTQGSYKILNWHGVGGQGKSALLREFQRIVATFNEADATAESCKQLITAKVDFEDERLKRVDAALYSLRRQLARESGYTFHTFDTAFIAYHSKTRPGADIYATFPELFNGEKEGMMDLIDVLDDPLTVASHLASAALPGAGLIYKWGARLTGKLAKWWSTRGNEQLTGIEHLQPEQLLERLPIYFGVDLCDNVKAKPDKRPVVLFDTYEALWANRGQKDGLSDRRADAWVRRLVQDSPGTLFVLAGRDALQWGEIDEAWKEVIASYPLGGLSTEDADAFLQAVPIAESDVRTQIISSSNGLPFYLDLQVSIYEAIREQEEMPTVEQFGGAPSEILARFLEHLSDVDQGTLRLASYLQIITQPVMDALADAFPGRAVNYSFPRMTARSSFEEISDGTFEIHSLMKEELQRREEEDNNAQFNRTHKWLFEWFERQMEGFAGPKMAGSFAVSFASAFYHRSSDTSADNVHWLLQNKKMLEIRNEWGVHKQLHDFAMSARTGTKELSDTETVALLCSLANSLFQQGQFDDALAGFVEARPLLESIETRTDADLARLDFNIARTEIECGQARDAASKLRSVIAAFEKNGGQQKPLAAFARASLAEIAFAEGDYASSAEDYVEAILLGQDSPDNQCGFLVGLSQALHGLGRHEEAVRIFHDALRYPDALMLEEYSADALREHRKLNGSVPLSLENVVPISWMDADEMSDYRERSIFDPLPKFFVGFERIHSSKASKEGTKSISKEILLNLKSNSFKDGKYLYTRHSKHHYLIPQIEEHLSQSEVGTALLRILTHPEIDLLILTSEVFDFGYSQNGKCVWLTLPDEIEFLAEYQLMCIVYALRTADHDLIGYPATRMKDGITAWAVMWHAKCLDRLVWMARHVICLPDEVKHSYFESISASGKKLVEAVEEEKSTEEIYDIYAQRLYNYNS